MPNNWFNPRARHFRRERISDGLHLQPCKMPRRGFWQIAEKWRKSELHFTVSRF